MAERIRQTPKQRHAESPSSSSSTIFDNESVATTATISLLHNIKQRVTISLEQSNSGFRKFLWDVMRTHLIDRRVTVLKTFMQRLEHKLNALDEAGIEEFRDIFVELGFTGNFILRFAQHEQGINSNYVMHMFLDCLRHHLQDGSQDLRQYVIGLCGSSFHAALGEIMVTRLAQGYVTSGTGFSHYPARRSVDPPRRKSAWAKNWQWTRDNSCLMENVKGEVARKQRLLEAKREEIDLQGLPDLVELMMMDKA
ncbi:uncharacterized protein RCC_04131 [Ramularia collo-cygni]|uniref:Uncharacterized protein n=1 Tax=Ramularia collo-cygni TaxID=112498 RepID=A0A2D3V0U9_9PEZI|nr:uncharacterized protein RCC_04131 [Ramularia collo-cygni]CZT18287.1 uncharacterized protein RCC_04131 [Ramularia collo-cygni]